MDREAVLAALRGSFRWEEYGVRFEALAAYANPMDLIGLIEAAVATRGHDDLELVMLFGHHHEVFAMIGREAHEVRELICDRLGALVDQSWHDQHESIVQVLEDMHHIAAVEPLHRAVFAKPPLLVELDEADALSRKAIWGLGKLVAPVLPSHPVDAQAAAEARMVLAALAQNRDEVVAERARRQLRRFGAAQG